MGGSLGVQKKYLKQKQVFDDSKLTEKRRRLSALQRSLGKGVSKKKRIRSGEASVEKDFKGGLFNTQREGKEIRGNPRICSERTRIDKPYWSPAKKSIDMVRESGGGILTPAAGLSS